MLEPAATHAQARRVAEDVVGVGSPLGTREVQREGLVREAAGVGQGEAEAHEVGGGHVDLESLHVTARRFHVVPCEARASIERLNVHVARGLLVELGEDLRRVREQALGIRADVALGVVLEGRVNILEHAEDVLCDDLVDVPTLLGELHALHGRSELRPDEETSICVLRENEPSPVLRSITVAAFRSFARHGDVLVEAAREFLDATEVDAREQWLEDVPTLESGLGSPPGRVGQVRTLAALLLCGRSAVAGVHDDDLTSLFGDASALGLDAHLLLDRCLEPAGICLVGSTAHPVRVVGVDTNLCEDAEGWSQILETDLVDRRSHDGVAS